MYTRCVRVVQSLTADGASAAASDAAACPPPSAAYHTASAPTLCVYIYDPIYHSLHTRARARRARQA